MSNDIERRLESLGILIPKAASPAGNYISYKISRGMVYLSGHTTRVDGKYTVAGKVGRDVSFEDAKKAARICAINLLSNLRLACNGDFNKVAGCVRVGGFVACVEEFVQITEVINAASEVIVAAFGMDGRHARTAVGVASLPSNSTVEVDAVFELKEC